MVELSTMSLFSVIGINCVRGEPFKKLGVTVDCLVRTIVFPLAFALVYKDKLNDAFFLGSSIVIVSFICEIF
jgi:hypothetical protein